MASSSENQGGTFALWGGRFASENDPLMKKFNSSIAFDKRMWQEDIDGSLAYVSGLKDVGLLKNSEWEIITDGLNRIREEWRNDSFVISPSDEDIHTAHERRLSELIGDELAGKIHTGRSRNDQVTTDMKLWLRKAICQLKKHIHQFLHVSVKRAQDEINVLMPGYTHLQPAQPIRFSHWVMCYAISLLQDLKSLEQLESKVSELTLGSGALAGNPFGVNREALANHLEFSRVTQNSLNATMDRDFVIDFLYWASMTMMHLSRWAEDLIIYCSKEFGFMRLSDAYSTGSSLMPQKKNPDSLELIRGKSGTVFGRLSGFMMTYKGLPSTYNKDLQEDKVAMFDTFDTMADILQIASGVLFTLTVNETACRNALSPDMLATDLAYYLVRKGMPFRQAHSISGRCVRLAEQNKCSLTDLTLTQLKSINPSFEEDVLKVWDYENSVEQYKATGGTSKSSVQSQMSHVMSHLPEISQI